MAPPETEYSVQGDTGCGLMIAFFSRDRLKQKKLSPPRPRPRPMQVGPTTKPQVVVKLAYTHQRLKKEPIFTSSDLSPSIFKPKKSTGNVMHLSHLGNLNQKPSKTTRIEERSNAKIGHAKPMAMKGNILTSLGRRNVDPEVLKSMGNDEYRRGRHEEALSLYDQAIAINPKNPSYHSNKSAALMGLSRLIEAVFECREAVRLDPLYHNAQYRLANLYFRLGEAEEALFHYERSGRKAERMDITRTRALITTINDCNQSHRDKDWSGLIKQSQNAVSLGSDSSPQIIAMQAEALIELLRHEEAYATIQKGHDFDTQKLISFFGSVKTAYFLAVKAQVHIAIGRFDDAVREAKRAMRLDSTYETLAKRIEAVANLRANANDLFKASKFAEALENYSKGLEHFPHNAVLLYNRAVCSSKLGLFDKALLDCSAALDLRPSYRKARSRRADCYMKLERWEAAIQDYEVLMKETPADDDVIRLYTAAIRRRRRVSGHRSHY